MSVNGLDVSFAVLVDDATAFLLISSVLDLSAADPLIVEMCIVVLVNGISALAA